MQVVEYTSNRLPKLPLSRLPREREPAGPLMLTYDTIDSGS